MRSSKVAEAFGIRAVLHLLFPPEMRAVAGDLKVAGSEGAPAGIESLSRECAMRAQC